MKRTTKRTGWCIAVSAVFLLFSSGTAQAYSFTGVYSQDFNSLGTSGTTLPSGWSFYYSDTSGGGTWSTYIPATGTGSVQSMTSASNQSAASAMLDTGIGSTTYSQNRWYNIARSTDTGNRVISSSPDTNAGAAFQLELTNNTASALNRITVSYDIVKFHNGWDNSLSSEPSVETLPGYQLFYSFSLAPNATWYNVSALNPTSANIPQNGTLGSLDYNVYSITNAVINLNSAWNVGTNLYLRWVDDNAIGLRPDQIIGIDNVVITPIPGAVWLLGSGLLGLVAFRRRFRK
ncbi:MAG: hypothetical protein HPY67_09180 [Syntrophaceae bacterium]|nr:hypothetical protein [Syntrophaceae bacterium]